MTAGALALFILVTLIACAAVVVATYLLDKRDQWRSIAGRRKALRQRALSQREEANAELYDARLRLAATEAHCIRILDERNQARNALLHASEELSRERLLRACAGKGFFRETWGDS